MKRGNKKSWNEANPGHQDTTSGKRGKSIKGKGNDDMIQDSLEKEEIELTSNITSNQIIIDEQESLIKEIFADPTYDITFKMLFGSEANKDILVSILNSLLNFRGDKKITEVEINTNELPVIPFSKEKINRGVSSKVDVLCKTTNGQKIAIEMQGQKTKYFLAREQEYMAKLLVGQVKEGEGKLYHEKVLETYIIVITKENVFVGNTALKDQKLFEIDVEPRIVQTNESYPDNKMHWKFFELAKFKNSSSYSKINKHSDLKEQWLEFLIECNSQQSEPERNKIIKKGYEIMKMSKWDSDTKALYWKQKTDIEDMLREQEELIKDTEKKAFEEGLLKGELKGKEHQKFKDEIKQFKTYKKMETENEGLNVSKYYEKLAHKDQIMSYFDKNPNNLDISNNESQIIGELDIDYGIDFSNI